MYQRGFSSLGCAERSLEAVLKLGVNHDLDGCELRALGGTLDLPAYFAREYGTPAALAAAVNRGGLRVVALDTSFKLIGAGPGAREALLAFAPWAEAAGARWLRVFDGGVTLDRAALAEAADALAWWRAMREERGIAVDVMVETHDVLLDAERIGAFLNAMPGRAPAVLWDAHHTWRRGGEDPLATWRAINAHVVHVHVKDSQTDVVGGGWRYVLPGAGEFPMERLRPVLAENFTGVVSLEWERLWHPQLPPLEQALRAAAVSRWW